MTRSGHVSDNSMCFGWLIFKASQRHCQLRSSNKVAIDEFIVPTGDISYTGCQSTSAKNDMT